MTSKQTKSLLSCIHAASKAIKSNQPTILCVGKLSKVRELFLNILPILCECHTAIQTKDGYTDEFLQPINAAQIDIVLIEEDTKQYTNSRLDKPTIRWNPSTQQYECPFDQVEEDFIILSSSQPIPTQTTTPILLLDPSEGESLPYDKALFTAHFPKTIRGVTPDPSTLAMSTTSKYSTAFVQDGKWTAELLASLVPTPDSILDACANVGGNTIPFASTFQHVIAVEYNKDEYKRLVNNIEAYHLESVVKTIQGSCLPVIHDIKHVDAMFFDPPWGGPSYKDLPQDMLVLGLDNQDTVAIIDECLQTHKADVIVLKHPYNTRIKSKYPNTTIKITKGKQHKEFYRLTVWFHPSIPSKENLLTDFNVL